MRPTALDPKVLRAYAHPLRATAMELLEARVTSPSEIAEALGQPLGVVAYHVRILREAGLVTLVERRQQRGAVEHFYTAPLGPTISDGEWSRLPVLERRAVIAGGLRRFGHEFGAAADHGGLERNGAHIRRIRARMDDRAWGTAARELKLALDQIEILATDAKLRLADLEPERTKYAVVMLMLFKEAQRRELDGVQSYGMPIDFADPRMLAADAHPLRSDIFRLLREHEASPSDLARRLGAPVSNASYHVRQLAQLGLIEPTVSRERRGALQHYYRAAMWPTIVADGWLDAIGDKAAAATALVIVESARQGGFDDGDIHFTRTPFPIDRQSWTTAIDVLADVRARVKSLAADCPTHSSTSATAQDDDVQVVTMLFERTLAMPQDVVRET